MDTYAVACDSCDLDLLRTVFTPDAVLDYAEFGGARTDVDSAIGWLSQGLPRYAGLHHNITTHYCVVEGDTARAVSYWIAFHTTVDGPGETMMQLGGYYKDRLVRTAAGWRISERADLGNWLMTPLPVRMTAPPAWYGTMDHHRPTLLEEQ
jgi:hypothetical protein